MSALFARSLRRSTFIFLIVFGRYMYDGGPTGVGFLYEAGLRIVSVRSRAHLYGVGHPAIQSRVFGVGHTAIRSRAFGVGHLPIE